MNGGHPLKSTDEILEFIRDRIAEIYARPLMYGGSAEGADLILHNYHELWAWIQSRGHEYDRASESVHSDEQCDAANFAFRFRRNHANAAETEAARYVVAQWKRIDERLNLPNELRE